MHQLYEMFSNCEAALVLMSQHNLAFNRTGGLSGALHLSFLLKLSLGNPLAKSNAARLVAQPQISEWIVGEPTKRSAELLTRSVRAEQTSRSFCLT